MATGRPARPNEIPRFGSVWVYSEIGPAYLALRLDGIRLVSLRLEDDVLDVETGMFWCSPTGGLVLRGWACIDEGPE